MTRTYVLDANALLDLVEAGSGFKKVEHLLHSALQEDTVVLMSVLNWGEVFYLLWQRRGEDVAKQVSQRVSSLPLELVPVDLPLAMQAGEIKALHKIPYVDCIAAALAMLNKATLVTSDRDFEKLGRRIPILWIARQ